LKGLLYIWDSRKVLTILITMIALSVSTKSMASTPSEVYQSTNNLVFHIEQIRLNKNITSVAKKPGVQIAKTPIHAYTKALEVFEKVIRFKEAHNWSHSKIPSLPEKNVTPEDVLDLIQVIIKELEDVNNKLGISVKKNSPLPEGKTPSDVYENLWRASYLFDGLVGAIEPTYVYRNTVRIEKALQKIAKKLNKSTAIIEPTIIQKQKPIDANISGYKVLYKLAVLEKELGLIAVRVSGFPAGKITPSDVYDTTNNIIAELTRINVHLNLPSVPDVDLSTEKITPSNVVFQFKKIELLLNNISS
jgi:hypothetical protein